MLSDQRVLKMVARTSELPLFSDSDREGKKNDPSIDTAVQHLNEFVICRGLPL